MPLVFEIYLVDEGESMLVARAYTPDKALEAVKELLRYLFEWEGVREGLEIKISIFEVPEEEGDAREA